MSFVAGVITMFPSFWLGQLVLATADATRRSMSRSATRTCCARSLGGALYVAACGLLGFALGALLRHTAGAITVAIGIVFVLPIVSNFLPGTWGDNVGKVLNAGGAITNTRPNNDDSPRTVDRLRSVLAVVDRAAGRGRRPDAPPRRLTQPTGIDHVFISLASTQQVGGRFAMPAGLLRADKLSAGTVNVVAFRAEPGASHVRAPRTGVDLSGQDLPRFSRILTLISIGVPTKPNSSRSRRSTNRR